jgi:hypothetical protein
MVVEMNQELKIKRVRNVSKLTQLALKYENATEPKSAYALSLDYEHEHRLWLSTEQILS